MTQKEKRELIFKKIEEGDKRSFNEIQADLELDIWREKMVGFRIGEYLKNLRPDKNNENEI